MRRPHKLRSNVRPIVELVRNDRACPGCGSLYCYFRTRTNDYRCRRCGATFLVNGGWSHRKLARKAK